MEIVLVRIDDRLIHGQIATDWSKFCGCNRIFVVSNEVANDSLRKTLLLSIAPPGITVNVLTLERGIDAYKNPKYKDFKVLMLFTNPMDVLKMIQLGLDVKSINVGGMNYRDGKKQVTSTVSVDEKDIEAFKELNRLGIELEIRILSSDKKIALIQKLTEEKLI